jgi:uncharacterized protein involved in exopolysaccharide biosynthesis
MPDAIVPVYPTRVTDEPKGGSPLRNVVLMVFKRRRLIIGLALAFTIGAAIAMLLKPPVYAATAKLLFKGDRTPLHISGLASQTGKAGYTPQILQSELELFKSREVLVPAATQLMTARDGKPPTPTDAAEEADAMVDRIAPVSLPDTNVIQVTYVAQQPAAAEQALRAIVDHYLVRHGDAYSGSGRLLKFYETEKDRIAGDLRGAEDDLKRWGDANNVVSIDGQITAQINIVSDLERALQQVNSQRDATEARVRTLEQQVSGQPERLVTLQEHVSNPLVGKLKGDLAAAEVEARNPDRGGLAAKLRADLVSAEVGLQDLLQRYTDKDRRVQEKREQVEAFRREIATAERDADAAAAQRLTALRKELASAEREAVMVGKETTGTNPVRDELARQLAGAQASLTSLGSQSAAVRAQLQESGRTLAAMRAKKSEAGRLTRLVDLNSERFLLYGKRVEEARIAAGLDREQLANVAVIEQPHLTSRDDFNKRVALVVVAGALGLMTGMAAAFALEFLNPSIRTREDVEYYLGLPVVAAIPDYGYRAPALTAGGAWSRRP